MKTRIIVGAALSALLLFVLFTGGYVFLSVVAVFSILAVYEIRLAFLAKGHRPPLIPAFVFAAAFPFVYALLGIQPLVALYVTSVMATMICFLFRKEHDVIDVVLALFVHMYPLLLMMCLLLIYDFHQVPQIGLTASFLAFAAPEVCDTAAYFGGTFLGKRKLCPAISPNKTVEGSAAALLGGLLFGALLIPLQRLWNGSVHMAVLLGLGLTAGVFSQFGDLFASVIKRWAGIKDYSSIFPGHGGILDRIDSILFCAPPVLMVFTILIRAGIY